MQTEFVENQIRFGHAKNAALAKTEFVRNQILFGHAKNAALAIKTEML